MSSIFGGDRRPERPGRSRRAARGAPQVELGTRAGTPTSAPNPRGSVALRSFSTRLEPRSRRLAAASRLAARLAFSCARARRHERGSGRAWRIPRARAPPARRDAAGPSGRSRRTRRCPRERAGASRDADRERDGRSAPGSSTRTPPATFTKTSAWPSAMPACREHRDDHREALRVDPGHRGAASRGRSARRAPAPRADRPRTSSSAHATAEPARRRPRRRAGRIRDADEPGTVISKTPSSFVEPKPLLAARRIRWRGTGRPRTGARSRRGARARGGSATAPSFVTCLTRIVATPDSFATRSSRAAASRTCATEPGADPSSEE